MAAVLEEGWLEEEEGGLYEEGRTILVTRASHMTSQCMLYSSQALVGRLEQETLLRTQNLL